MFPAEMFPREPIKAVQDQNAKEVHQHLMAQRMNRLQENVNKLPEGEAKDDYQRSLDKLGAHYGLTHYENGGGDGETLQSP